LIKASPLVRALVAEAIGTFALVFAGCGAIMVDAKTHQLGHIGVAISFGLVIMFGIYAVGHISGAHFNAAVLAVATDTRAVGEAAAIAIGGTIGLDAMFGGPISGASMNPMRSLGPGIVSGDLHAIWIYLLAPIVGTAIGGLAYQFVRGEATRPAELRE
jgi:glycerol uptake facilitator-like aquaporin